MIANCLWSELLTQTNFVCLFYVINADRLRHSIPFVLKKEEDTHTTHTHTDSIYHNVPHVGMVWNFPWRAWGGSGATRNGDDGKDDGLDVGRAF